VPKVNKAAVSCTGIVGGGTLVVSMLGAKTPTTGLPKGAFFNPVAGRILIAPEAVRENNVVSPTSFSEDSAVL